MIEAIIHEVKVWEENDYLRSMKRVALEARVLFVDTDTHEQSPLERCVVNYEMPLDTLIGTPKRELLRELMLRLTTAIQKKRDRLEHERLSHLHPSEQIREICAAAEAAGEMERHGGSLSDALRTRTPGRTGPAFGPKYTVGLGAGSSPIYAGDDDGGGGPYT